MFIRYLYSRALKPRCYSMYVKMDFMIFVTMLIVSCFAFKQLLCYVFDVREGLVDKTSNLHKPPLVVDHILYERLSFRG